MQWLTGQSMGSQVLWVRKLRQFIGLCSSQEASGGSTHRELAESISHGTLLFCAPPKPPPTSRGTQKSWPLVPVSSTKAIQTSRQVEAFPAPLTHPPTQFSLYEPQVNEDQDLVLSHPCCAFEVELGYQCQ